jgi:hypothetical protein
MSSKATSRTPSIAWRNVLSLRYFVDTAFRDVFNPVQIESYASCVDSGLVIPERVRSTRTRNPDDRAVTSLISGFAAARRPGMTTFVQLDINPAHNGRSQAHSFCRGREQKFASLLLGYSRVVYRPFAS